jgi:hypothetical protein
MFVHRRRIALFALIAAALAYPVSLLASAVTIPNTFVNGQVADANQVNANFSALATAVNDNNSQINTLNATSLTSSQYGNLVLGGNADGLHTHSGLGPFSDWPNEVDSGIYQAANGGMMPLGGGPISSSVTVVTVSGGKGMLDELDAQWATDLSSPATFQLRITIDGNPTKTINLPPYDTWGGFFQPIARLLDVPLNSPGGSNVIGSVRTYRFPHHEVDFSSSLLVEMSLTGSSTSTQSGDYVPYYYLSNNSTPSSEFIGLNRTNAIWSRVAFRTR